MREIGVNSLTEVALFVPGLRIQEQSANNPGFVIRGITSDNGSSQQGARVTLYYNGVDISRSRGAYQDLFDVERLEVVKGPQATLFGTAAAVGAISIVSAKPQPGFSGELLASYGNYDRTQVSGFLTPATTRSRRASPSRTNIAKAMSATSPAIPTSPTRTRAASIRTISTVRISAASAARSAGHRPTRSPPI
jgi:outer membrane receptor protein involved in Fe transport